MRIRLEHDEYSHVYEFLAKGTQHYTFEITEDCIYLAPNNVHLSDLFKLVYDCSRIEHDGDLGVSLYRR